MSILHKLVPQFVQKVFVKCTRYNMSSDGFLKWLIAERVTGPGMGRKQSLTRFMKETSYKCYHNSAPVNMLQILFQKKYKNTVCITIRNLPTLKLLVAMVGQVNRRGKIM